MSEFWWGLLTLPAIAVGGFVISLVLRLLAMATAVLPGALQRVTPDTDERRRAVYGSIIYSATRAYWFGFGDVGLGFVVGQQGRDRGDAFDRLYAPPRVRLNPAFFDSQEPGDDH